MHDSLILRDLPCREIETFGVTKPSKLGLNPILTICPLLLTIRED